MGNKLLTLHNWYDQKGKRNYVNGKHLRGQNTQHGTTSTLHHNKDRRMEKFCSTSGGGAPVESTLALAAASTHHFWRIFSSASSDACLCSRRRRHGREFLQPKIKETFLKFWRSAYYLMLIRYKILEHLKIVKNTFTFQKLQQ